MRTDEGKGREVVDDVRDGIPVIEQGARFLFDRCVSVEQVGALWAALDSAVSDCAKETAERLGGDPEKLRESIDRFYLESPL